MAAKRPTILQIIPELDTGGAELSTIEIASAITQAGGRAIVLSEGGRLVQRLRDTGAELQFFPAAVKNPVRLVWNAHKIAGIVRAEGVDLVHARSRAPAWSALMAARRTGVPFVTTYHGAYSEGNAVKRLYNSVMARGEAVIANSHYTADLIRMRYGTPAARLHVIYRGLDERQFDPALVVAHRVAALRAEWGVAPAERVMLHAARLTSWKGQSVVIEAARLLHEQGRLGDAVIVLAGDTQGRGAYQASAGPGDRRSRARGTRAHRRPRGRHCRSVSGRPRCRRRLHRAGGLRTRRDRGPGHGNTGDRHRHRRAAGDRARLPARGAGRGNRVARAAVQSGAARRGHGGGAGARARGAIGDGCARPRPRHERLLADGDEAADAAGLRRAPRHPHG